VEEQHLYQVPKAVEMDYGELGVLGPRDQTFPKFYGTVQDLLKLLSVGKTKHKPSPYPHYQDPTIRRSGSLSVCVSPSFIRINYESPLPSGAWGSFFAEPLLHEQTASNRRRNHRPRRENNPHRPDKKPASRKPATRGSSKPYNDKDRKKRTPQYRTKAENSQ
jgi:hypothetical protein